MGLEIRHPGWDDAFCLAGRRPSNYRGRRVGRDMPDTLFWKQIFANLETTLSPSNLASQRLFSRGH